VRKAIIELIFKIAKEKDAFDQLEKYLSALSIAQLKENLIECGILPEMFDHDSSEEKLWAKFSDILLAKVLTHLGIAAEVLGARGNTADVWGKAKNYSIVGDAKTFRLSRTAKNQKDFKVNALDSWRKEDNYALLVAPLLQYPNTKSQIYAQAIEKNVTLISYTHLRFLLDFYIHQDLQPIWATGVRLSKNSSIHHQHSETYWNEIDEIIAKSVGKNTSDLQAYKLLEIQITQKIGYEGIAYWQEKIASFQTLSKEEAIKLLIKSEKIDSKIKTIAKTINIKITS
jgi:HindIII restriction endonuclease